MLVFSESSITKSDENMLLKSACLKKILDKALFH